MNFEFNYTSLIMAKRHYILALAFSFLFTSCCNEENGISIDTNSGIFIFSFNEENDSLPSYWTIGDTIGIITYVSNGYELYMNGISKRYKLSSESAFIPVTKEDQIFHPLVHQSVDFIAYYPYQANDSNTYTIFLDDQQNQKQIDLLYSNNAKNKIKTNEDIELVFNHALSKIVINTTPSGGLIEEDLHEMDITITNISNEGTFNLGNGDIKPSDQKASIKMMSKIDGSSSEAIILPGVSSDIELTIELMNGNVYSTTFPQEQWFIAGHVHTYNITITQMGINLSPIKIEDWIITGNDIQEEIADEIVYRTGDFYPNPNNPNTAIGIVYWLKPGTGGKEGKIVSYDTETKNWGNSNDRNLNTRISNGVINWDIVVNTDPTLENFPAFKWCKDKGDGWYLPARYELHVLNELWTTHGEYMNSNIILINGEPFTSDDIYLASSESRSWPNDMAELYSFSDKGWMPISKSDPGRIRAVKGF